MRERARAPVAFMLVAVRVGLIIGLAAAAYEPTTPADTQALRALYFSAGGHRWSDKGRKNWLHGDPCGDAPYHCGLNCNGWYGVHCWGPGGHVRKLDLHGVGLHGVLPTELGLLTGIATLDLSGGGGLSTVIHSAL